MSAMPEGNNQSFPFDVDIAVKDSAWGDVLEDPEQLSLKALGAALSVLETPKYGELSIALIDDQAMQALNSQHRGKNNPTNTLSFPSIGPAPMLGDIVIARETVLREAEALGIDPLDHLVHLLVHSFLHLQGYDHDNDTDADIMETIEITALASLGIDNPYQIKEHLDS